jgi:2-polyprenyl-6-methoxyphenol hydroxylase-like FAD-dependent oxidoreductase
MFGKKPPQVLVVGAGPVGLFAALALTRHGVRVQIVDKEWRTGKHSYALALHAASLQMLDEAGLLADVLEKSYRVRGVGLYDGRGRRGEMRVSDLATSRALSSRRCRSKG